MSTNKFTPQQHQATYNKVKKHLLTQNKKALIRLDDGLEHCQYRTPEGLKCAAGCLIPDDKYSLSMEGLGCMTHMSPLREVLESEGHDPEFVYALQSVHDRRPVEDWQDALCGVAKEHNLIP